MQRSINRLTLGLSLIFIGAYAAGATSPSSVAPLAFSSASAVARPDSICTLAPTNDHEPSHALTVHTGHDGVARFGAVRADAPGRVRSVTLACRDAAGVASSTEIDLANEATFATRASDLASEPGVDRPALEGDPMARSVESLIQAGYGPRPDPVRSPDAYRRWREASQRDARIPAAVAHAPRTRLPIGQSAATVTHEKAPWWVGTVLNGAPNYDATSVEFVVPTVIPGGDSTATTGIAIWNGLGGFGTGSGLIQGGIQINTTNTLATYGVFREYCCGNPTSNSYSGTYSPKPGDLIYSVQWYCDANGSVNLNGGYGCSHIQDLSTGQLLDCSSSNGSPCPSVKALPSCSANPQAANCETRGADAEFIVENVSPQLTPPSNAFTDFAGTLTMAGSANSEKTQREETITTDPDVRILDDFTNLTTHLYVDLGTSNQTKFTITGRSGHILKYNGATCDALCDAWTMMDDNPDTVDIVASLNNVYQRHRNGDIWKFTGTFCTEGSCPGWVRIGNDPSTAMLAADGSNLYRMNSNGAIYTWNGTVCNGDACLGWKKISGDPTVGLITASGGNLYRLHNDATHAIDKYVSQTLLCNGIPCGNWLKLDNNPGTYNIVSDGAALYQQHFNGEIWRYAGTPCSGTNCPGWTKLDINPGTQQIAASGGNLYQTHTNGEIWKSTGVACSGNSCPGWIRLDVNPSTTWIWANRSDLYQRHADASMWKYTGTACSGTSCPGWKLIDNFPATMGFATGGGQAYALYYGN